MSQSPPLHVYLNLYYIFRDLFFMWSLCKFSKHKFHPQPHSRSVYIDRIYRINRTETWNFNAPILVSSVSLKSTAKCGILCPKTPLLTEKQLHAIHFFVATRNVCPLAIPESCAQNMGLRLLENHSFNSLPTYLRALLSERLAQPSQHFMTPPLASPRNDLRNEQRSSILMTRHYPYLSISG